MGAITRRGRGRWDDVLLERERANIVFLCGVGEGRRLKKGRQGCKHLEEKRHVRVNGHVEVGVAAHEGHTCAEEGHAHGLLPLRHVVCAVAARDDAVLTRGGRGVFLRGEGGGAEGEK